MVRVGLLAAAIAVVLDQATKALAVDVLATRVIQLPGPFHFDLTFNDGGAFGLPAPWWFFLGVTVVVVVVVGRALTRTLSFAHAAAYGLLLAGAVGNVVDRLTRAPGFPRGHVVDFIASTFWPTFNLADVSITFGCLVLLVTLRREDTAA